MYTFPISWLLWGFLCFCFLFFFGGGRGLEFFVYFVVFFAWIGLILSNQKEASPKRQGGSPSTAPCLIFARQMTLNATRILFWLQIKEIWFSLFHKPTPVPRLAGQRSWWSHHNHTVINSSKRRSVGPPKLMPRQESALPRALT